MHAPDAQSPVPAQRHPVLTLPSQRTLHWREALPAALSGIPPGPVDLVCADWALSGRELLELLGELETAGYPIRCLEAQSLDTVVSGHALGLPTRWIEPSDQAPADQPDPDQPHEAAQPDDSLRLHRGTLRSGDHLTAQGHLLVLGDVNPGARVTAGGDVLVWGRLRGSAHAGVHGHEGARIVALQLRPLQLRIADTVARGPEERPQPGLAEQARLEAGEIVIEAADAQMPTPPLG